MSLLRTRLSVGLISLAVLALELALMRAMSLRFWHHFAHMVISVALLGFGASGTFLTLLRGRIQARRRGWLCGLALAFAASIPASLLAAERVPLNVRFLAWDLSQLGWVLAVELVLFVPFFLAAGAIGVVLMGRAEHVPGHYAANLAGSGVGALAAVGLMCVLSTGQLLTATAMAGLAAALLVLPWRRAAAVLAACCVAAGLGWFAWRVRYEPGLSRDKMLSLAREMDGTRELHHAEGPLGRLDVVANDAFHYAPWLSLAYTEPPPEQVLLLLDGDAVCPVYRCGRAGDWRFADYATAAAGYHLGPVGSVLVVGTGGGGEIGLASYHRTPRIVALEMNGRVIDAMRGPLAELGGRVYDAPGVQVVEAEARGYLASAAGGERFDLIQLPPLDAFGAAGAGLHAAQESYLYTVESFAAMLGRLSETGVLCVTRRAWSPPRDGLRAFDTAAEALRRVGKDPLVHLAMIRSWATVTVLAFASPIRDAQAAMLRAFCRERSFDLCYLLRMAPAEANRFHVLDRPYFYEGAAALLGPRRRQYLAEYLYDVAAGTDDRPYFHHFFRWRSLRTIAAQRPGRARGFLELGYLMLLAALGQAAVLAAALILLPLAPAALRRAGPGRRDGRARGGRGATLAFFLLLGAGFMLLEMGFLQRLILYLAHPIISAAVVIAGFLIFAGIGSEISRRWRAGPDCVISSAALGVMAGGVLFVLLLDEWLSLTQTQPLGVRIAVAALTIAPLAFAMGHMFPTGLRSVASARAELVPWAWAVNGFASVLATVGAPLLAMEIGFSGLTITAVACYAAAGLVARRLPRAGRPMMLSAALA